MLVRDMIAAQQILGDSVAHSLCCHDFVRSGMDIIGTAKAHEECFRVLTRCDWHNPIYDKDLPYTKYRIILLSDIFSNIGVT